MTHIEKVEKLLADMGDYKAPMSPSEENLDDCLKQIGKVIKGAFKGRAPSISPSNFGKLTPDEMALILSGRGDEVVNDFSPNLKFKMLCGGVIEHLFVLLLREAGVEVDASAHRGEFQPVEGFTMKGSADYVIDGVIDCKTTNGFSFNKKFSSAEALAGKDDYGYLVQAKCYAESLGLDFVGWDVIETNFFNTKHISAEDIQMEMDMAYERACNNLKQAMEMIDVPNDL